MSFLSISANDRFLRFSACGWSHPNTQGETGVCKLNFQEEVQRWLRCVSQPCAGPGIGCNVKQHSAVVFRNRCFKAVWVVLVCCFSRHWVVLCVFMFHFKAQVRTCAESRRPVDGTYAPGADPRWRSQYLMKLEFHAVLKILRMHSASPE